MGDYEEYRVTPAFWGWVIIVVICLALIGWGLANYALVRNAPRQWDYGALPEPPAGSVYTTSQPPAGTPPQRQIAPLPNARPLPAGEPQASREGKP